MGTRPGHEGGGFIPQSMNYEGFASGSSRWSQPDLPWLVLAGQSLPRGGKRGGVCVGLRLKKGLFFIRGWTFDVQCSTFISVLPAFAIACPNKRPERGSGALGDNALPTLPSRNDEVVFHSGGVGAAFAIMGAAFAGKDFHLIQSPQQSGHPRPQFFRPLKKGGDGITGTAAGTQPGAAMLPYPPHLLDCAGTTALSWAV